MSDYEYELLILLTLKAHFGIITSEQREKLKELQDDRSRTTRLPSEAK